MTHPSGHIENVANQWRCWDHTTGGCWTFDAEEHAQQMLRALELRDEARNTLAGVKAAVVAAMEVAEAEDAFATLRRLQALLRSLGK